MKQIIVALILVLPALTAAQTLAERYAEYGTVIKLECANAPFPDVKRANGHTYGGKTYPASEHYRDSSVAVFIPKGWKGGNGADVVVYFHGWFNNIDTTLALFRLIEQFSQSKKNAFLIVVQGPKNAPDSYGGKLEEAGRFKALMKEVAERLVKKKLIPSSRVGKVILAGHSGAYRVISYILLRGGMTIHEVYLFDALYAHLEKYTRWIDRMRGKFVTVYTDSGGTNDLTLQLAEDLQGWGIPFLHAEEDALTPDQLRKHRIILIHTPLSHNEVIHTKNQFFEYIRASALKDIR